LLKLSYLIYFDINIIQSIKLFYIIRSSIILLQTLKNSFFYSYLNIYKICYNIIILYKFIIIFCMFVYIKNIFFKKYYLLLSYLIYKKERIYMLYDRINIFSLNINKKYNL
jgi:hypothetical protein